VPNRRSRTSLNIHDPQLPKDVSETLLRMKELGFDKADTPYVVDTQIMESHDLSLLRLRNVLKARQTIRIDASGTAVGKSTPIMNAVGQDKTHTLFSLCVDLTA
jgi:hypothetical protein